MSDSRSSRRGGIYFSATGPKISVTKVISVLDKPQLRYWYGQQIWEAMVANPNLDQKATHAAPYAQSKKAMDRGTTVHSIVEAYKSAGVVITSLPQEFKGYGLAFYKWAADHQIAQENVLYPEKTVESLQYHYAGTVDLILSVNNETWIVDVKTNKTGDLYPEVELQASAYMQAYNEALEGSEIPVTRLFGLGLAPSGKYTFKELNNQLEAFLACQKIFVWQNRAFLEKIDYPVNLFLKGDE